MPGATRDVVSQTIQIEGVPLHVIDTAGLRLDDEAADEVERIGMARSWDAIAEADAVIFLHDLTRRGDPAYEAGDAAIAQRLHLDDAARVLHVHNKADAAPATQPGLAVSARTGQGLDALRRALLEHAGWHAAPEGVFIARARHVHALRRTRAHLGEAQALAASADPALDLLAEELRLAHDALGEIFSRFCIGK